MLTLARVIQHLSEGEDFNLCCPAFLDCFYAADQSARFSLIRDEPELFDNVGHFFYCDVAAIAHKLANDYGLPVPEWVHRPVYVFSEPYYPIWDKSNEVLKEYLRSVSPPEFAMRNIFVYPNTLSRV